MDILSATDLASKPRPATLAQITQHPKIQERHGQRRRAFDRETFIDIDVPNKSMVTRSKNQCLPDLASDQNVISVQMNHAQVIAPSQNS
jgi:hypothetical protein